MRSPLLSFFLLCVFALSHSLAWAQDQKPLDPKYTWDLTELYASEAAWREARQEVLDALAGIEKKKGSLGKSAAHLYDGLSLISNTLKSLQRVYVYASLREDEDLRNTHNQELNQLAEIAVAEFTKAISWLEPEILTIGEKKIKRFLKKNDKLQPFSHFLDDTLRNASHTLDEKGESILAQFSQPISAPNGIYSLLANSDIPWPTIKLSTGEEHRIDSAGYSRWRQSENRADRKQVFDAYWGKWKDYRNSVGSVLNAHIQSQVALAKARNFESVLQRELFQDNLPQEVYHTLVREVNDALPTLHRYFRLRAKMLDIDQMHYYDIYPPLVSLDKKFDLETSKAITLDAMQRLGDDWVKMQREAMDKRWMHVYPQKGKRSGAYMNGSAYDVHPYILLNHNEEYDSLSTFAHEWGHAMHTLYAMQSQPFETYRYATFIAEIPSTSLELILREYMVAKADTVDEKIFYLGTGLEALRGTFFRQTMFAEFELSLYETVEKGEALTGEKISQMYGEILKRYHGHDQGVVLIDELYTNEWMFIPHFYYNMYVFQYATSITAGTALYEKIVEEGDAGVENYKNLLRAGGSDYPYNLLKDAGVDLAKPEPFKAIVKRMNVIMDEMERLLAEERER